MVKMFLAVFLKDPFDSFVGVDNLRLGQIMGAEQVTVRVCLQDHMCCPRCRKLMGKEVVLIISF